ncbi:MAG TPA: hypothetical protein PKC39_04100 [Ferruginibacter sp.]|nr:hypothetical protein [Ferruginibacter sp.]HMP20122.1 hypothetical protein [Ferruginibacter sp.]
MKIEQLIVQHLYSNKNVSLQGIGTFILNPTVVLPAENDKDFVMPEGAISFEYNLKATEDAALIDFITQKTKKLKSLSASDLESYTILAKQFLNIGKPLIIEGIGTIQKNQGGVYEFTPGRFISPKIEEPVKEIKSKAEQDISFESESKKNNSKRNVLIGTTLVVLIFVSLGLYYWFTNNSNNSPEETQMLTDIPADTAQAITPDTLITTPKPDSSAVDTVLPVANYSGFKIVLKEYNSIAAATKAFGKLSQWGHKLEIITIDSAHHRLAMPFSRAVEDTAKVRDSLRRFFGGNPFVLLQ